MRLCPAYILGMDMLSTRISDYGLHIVTVALAGAIVVAVAVILFFVPAGRDAYAADCVSHGGAHVEFGRDYSCWTADGRRIFW